MDMLPMSAMSEERRRDPDALKTRDRLVNGTEHARVNISWPVHTRDCRNGAYNLHPCMFRAVDGVC